MARIIEISDVSPGLECFILVDPFLEATAISYLWQGAYIETV